ncbi:pilus biosynthesis protein [Bifidobacterium dolichotidis]|uniref:Pilus biosynthesis protein n=1 Tax=Bifidobacterium dolichotidis TaxID=2306976 RepID=A0A430FQN7_9BIFI|nr:pilus assembly protein [Bifidobacterium dolichotidis]RSX55162.1 pilus biosynthesis protein [Bifidobacterium dolichotidis]
MHLVGYGTAVALAMLWCLLYNRIAAASQRLLVFAKAQPPHETNAATTETADGMGLGVWLASAVASLHSGLSFDDVCAAKLRDSAGNIDVQRLHTALQQHQAKEDNDDQLNFVCQGLVAAYELSGRLGCHTAVCCEAVQAAYKRMRLQADLTANAFAVPRSTVRVLSALPLLTLLLGECLGAHPIQFLLSSPAGWLCLLTGSACYAFGLWWLHMLLTRATAQP